MDPFTLATGIAGLIGLAIQLGQITTDYVACVVGADISIGRFQAEVSNLSEVLKELKAFLEAQKSAIVFFSETAVIRKATDACKKTLTDANNKLDRFSKSSKLPPSIRHMLWPFKEADLEKLVGDLHRYSSTFQFSLTTQGCEVLSKSALEVSAILEHQIRGLEGTRKLALSLSGINIKIDKVVAQLQDLSDDQISRQKDDIAQWFSRSDPFSNYLTACRKHVPGTGNWLLSCDSFKAWSTQANSWLWLDGIAGSGKTILS